MKKIKKNNKDTHKRFNLTRKINKGVIGENDDQNLPLKNPEIIA